MVVRDHDPLLSHPGEQRGRRRRRSRRDFGTVARRRKTYPLQGFKTQFFRFTADFLEENLF